MSAVCAVMLVGALATSCGTVTKAVAPQPSLSVTHGSKPIELALILGAFDVHAGDPIRATLVLTNTTQHSEILPCGLWYRVGLTSPTVQFHPIFPAQGCLGDSVLRPGSSRLQTTILTTYEVCSGPGSPGSTTPKCIPRRAGTPSRMPPLPMGKYQTVVVTRGQGYGIQLPPAMTVTLH